MTATKRTIEVDDATAAALEARATEAGLSVSELLAAMVAHRAGAEASPADLAELDRQWASIKSGEPTVPHQDVVRWLDPRGDARLQAVGLRLLKHPSRSRKLCSFFDN